MNDIIFDLILIDNEITKEYSTRKINEHPFVSLLFFINLKKYYLKKKHNNQKLNKYFFIASFRYAPI